MVIWFLNTINIPANHRQKRLLPMEPNLRSKIEATRVDAEMIKKYAHAEACFRSCQDYLNLYLKEKVEWKTPKSRAFLTAAIIEYAKPFKNSHAVDKIDASIVPQRYRDLHELLIKSRDKYLAHIDKNGLEKPEREFHRVHIVKRGRSIYTDVESPRIPPIHIHSIISLSTELRKKSLYYLQKHLKKYHKHFLKSKGDKNWEIKIEKKFCGFFPAENNELTNIEWE